MLGQSVQSIMEPRYILAENTVVREEDFGLLFYTMAGPRLFFLGSGKLLGTGFFDGKFTLGQWLAQEGTAQDLREDQITRLQEGLESLRARGALIEC